MLVWEFDEEQYFDSPIGSLHRLFIARGKLVPI